MKENFKLESILELASLLNEQKDFEEILRVTTSKASEIFNSSSASIVMVNPTTDHTIKTIIRNGEEFGKRRQHLIQTNVIGWMNKHNSSFISQNLKSDDRFRSYIFDDYDSCSVISSNLKTDGKVIGYIIVSNTDGAKCMVNDDLDILESFSSIVAPYLDRTQKVSEYFKAKAGDSDLFSKYREYNLIGKSKAFREMLKSIDAASRCDVRVLLRGSSGTGKEIIARAIHKSSGRKNNKFVAVDCGAIPEHLIESELFGHVRGAFTGAVTDRKGLFAEADAGTIFMDEIANLPLQMQAKLLRVLQENEVRILGSNKTIKVNVRVISACSDDLMELVSAGKFREDLYYRLNVYKIEVPSLNSRTPDIPELSNHFLKKFSRAQNKRLVSIDKDMLKFLRTRNWPGNVRELENFIERAVTIASDNAEKIDKSCLTPEYLKEYIAGLELLDEDFVIKPLQESLDEFEEELIKKALIACKWNQSKAARALKISERTIRYKIDKLGIVRPKEDIDH